MKTIDDIDLSNVPRHVAVIMDGNGRWAQRQSEKRLYGHQHAVQAVRDTVEAAARLHVDYLTLYTFSTENWNRPKDEVDGLMQLMIKAVEDETSTLLKNNVRLLIIGDIQRVPESSRESIMKCCADTAANTGTTLVLALSYSSRWEIAEALRTLATDVAEGTLKPEEIDEDTIRKYLETREMPDPDLLIRTGGELRVSNFLLWQMAYTEFYFTDILWPDFRMGDFYEAVFQYQNRQRRFGKTGDQVKQQQP
ncbi:MAG: isoprenyl transferase [Bacteroidales bacterium]|nr:isoprenyl transferase [Bacteroidales bacterium]